MLQVAKDYGSKEAKIDMKLVDRWYDQIMDVLDGPVEMEGMLLRPNTEYRSPLKAELWHAWQVATNDPDNAIQMFI